MEKSFKKETYKIYDGIKLIYDGELYLREVVYFKNQGFRCHKIEKENK